MQPAPDKSNSDDSESLFDFLDGDQGKPADQSDDRNGRDSNRNRRRRTSSVADSNAEKPFPVIRKPVSVSETGPLKAPRPGDPVEPPPALTDGVRSTHVPETPRQPPRRGRPSEQVEIDLSAPDDLDLDDDEWPSSDNWADKSHRPVPVNYPPARTSLARKAAYVLAFSLIACGAGYALIGVPAVQQWTESTITNAKEAIDRISGAGAQSETSTSNTGRLPATDRGDVSASDNALVTSQTSTSRSLNELFREQLAQLEVLVQNGSLDAAEQVIDEMDRAVYGYGAPEFTAISERIAALRQSGGAEVAQTPLSQNTLEEEPLTEQHRLQEAASQLEQEELARTERQAAEAAQAEQQRAAELAAEQQRAAELAAEQQRAAELAAEQQRAAELAAEQQRAAELAAEQQRAAEAARLESERVEQQRIALEAERVRIQQADLARAEAEAAQVRADRLAQEQARREQLALALEERARLEQQSAASNQNSAAATSLSSDWQAVTPGVNDESVQQLAADQREAARQQRLIEARQREEQTAGSLPPGANDTTAAQNSAPAVPETIVALADPSPEPVAESNRPTPISDADLQQVYGRFAQLQNAIESRDINTVIALTQQSGARIQQVMQMFANNVAITARLRNVSTLDAAGEIQGILQITRLERADGAVTGPPRNFSSVRLSSVRDGDGWSRISW